MIMLRNGEKKESTMCVVLIDLQEEVPWRQKHEQYLDGPEESQIRFCKHTNHTQCRTNQRSPRLHASMMVPDQSQSGWCKNTHRTQRHTHQRSSRLHASMIMLRNGEKEEPTMCVVLIGLQEEGPWRRKHEQYLDDPEQLQSQFCKHTNHTQCRTHQRSPRLHASMIMLRNGEK